MEYNPFFPPDADLNELNLEIQDFEANLFLDEEIENLNGCFIQFNEYLIAFDKKGFVILENTSENSEKFKQKRFKKSDSIESVNALKLNYICNKSIYLKKALDVIYEITDIKFQLKRCNLDKETLNQILNNLLYYNNFYKITELFEYAINNDELGNLFEYMFLLREAFSENWKTYARNVFSKGAGVLKDQDMYLLQQQILEFAIDLKKPRQEIITIASKVKSRITKSIEPKTDRLFSNERNEANYFSGKEPDEYEYLGGIIYEDFNDGLLISDLAIARGSSFRTIDFNVSTVDLTIDSTFYVEKPFNDLSIPFGAKLNQYQITESGVIYSFSMFDKSSLIEYEKRVLEKVRESQIANEELDFVINLLPEDLPNELSNLQDLDLDEVIEKLKSFLKQCSYNNSKLSVLNKNPNSIFEFVLKNKTGNCLAYSQLISAILNANGFETYLALSNNIYDSYKGFSSVGHAVLLIVNPKNGRIQEFDATKHLKNDSGNSANQRNLRAESQELYRKSKAEELKHNQGFINTDVFSDWLDDEGQELSYIDFDKIKNKINKTRINSDIEVNFQAQNSFTLRSFLNEVVKNRPFSPTYLITDADLKIFKSFLAEEIELDITYIKNKDLRYKLKLLGVDSKISIFDLFEFYFALTDEVDKKQLLDSQILKACFTLIYNSIDNYLEIADSLEVNSGKFRSPDFDSLLDDDLELLIPQIIKERFSEELIENFRKFKKQKESPKLISKLNSTLLSYEYVDTDPEKPKFCLEFEENLFLSVFEGISVRLKQLAFRANQSPEWYNVREYQVGDDVRYINHKVTGRYGKTHVNVYKNTEVNTPDQSILIVPFCTNSEALVNISSMLKQLSNLAIKENVTIKVYNAVDNCIHTFSPQELQFDDDGTVRAELNNLLKLKNPDGQVPLIPGVDCMETIYLNAQPGSLYKTAFDRVQTFHSEKGMKCRVIDAKLT